MSDLFEDVPDSGGTMALDIGTLPPPPKWSAPTTLPDLRGVVAIDLETRDPTLMTLGSCSAFSHRKDGYIIGVAVAADGFSGYYPIRHEGGGNVELDVMGWLRAMLAKPDVEMVGANTPYDLAWLLQGGADLACDPWDVQGMAALLDENRFAYSLDALGKDYLGAGKEDLMGFSKGIKDRMWQLPAAYVGGYAERDAVMTLELHRVLWKKMVEENLQRVSDLERPCLRIATEMRLRGVPYDMDGAERVRKEMLAKEVVLLERIKTETGVAISATDNEAIGFAVREVGLHPPTTAKTNKTSITAEWLEAQDHPVCKMIRELRRWNKARTGFVESHMEYAGESAGRGRIHGEFHPLRRVEEEGGTSRGTVSGRFSGTDPNLQNIPARDPEVRKRVRTLFLAEDGAEWGAADYSSQEPRLTVHFAYMTKRNGRPLPGAEAAVEAYAKDPRLDYHKMTAEIMGISRTQAKGINLGLTYGMGGASLCRHLGLPTEWKEERGKRWEGPGEEGARLIKLYNERLPFAKILSDTCKSRVNDVGKIRTLLGRLCHWPEKHDPRDRERPFSHKALNRLIQGSAADQMKAAMVMLWREHREVPLVTVHDELGFNAESPEHLARIQRCMEEAVTLVVPTVVDITTGRSWGDAKG